MTKQCYFCSYPNKDDAERCINCGLKLIKYWYKSEGKIQLVDKRKQ